MKLVILFFILFCCVLARSEPNTDPARYMTAADYQIYLETLKKCALGDTPAIINTAFDLQLLKSGVLNWYKIASFDVGASRARSQAGFLTPEISRLRRSDGFWLAMTHCFQPEDKFWDRGNLIKQIVDLGHLATEVTAVSGVVLSLNKAATVSQKIFFQFPMAARYLVSAGLSFSLGQVIEIIKADYLTDLTIEEKQKLQNYSEMAFREPNQLIDEVAEMTKIRVKFIDEQLKTLPISDLRVDALMLKRQRLTALLNEMHSLQGIQAQLQ